MDIASQLFPNLAPSAPHEAAVQASSEPPNESPAERMFGGMERGTAGATHGAPLVEPEPVASPAGGTPEAYQPFQVPKDLQHLGLVHDAEAFKSFTVTAKELGLSQSAAQRLVDLHLRRTYGAKK